MKLELIPVLEIGYHMEEVPFPYDYPYWEFPESWDKYRADCYKLAGFPDPFHPYLPGSAFYRLSEISDRNLTKLVLDYFREAKEGIHIPDAGTSFFGGLVLKIDGQDKYFPQICGSLSNIFYWERLANGNKENFFAGGLIPKISIQNDIVTFDFSTDEDSDGFEPAPDELLVSFDRKLLQEALVDAMQELHAFEERLQTINHTENLQIDDIGNLLIWDRFVD